MTKPTVRNIIFLLLLLFSVLEMSHAQLVGSVISGNATFTFLYHGSTEIAVNDNCVASLDWGHPGSVTLDYEGSPGASVTEFDIHSISGGYEINDLIPKGEAVKIKYFAKDNMGNTANFTFTLYFVDRRKPIIDIDAFPDDIFVSCINNLPGKEDITASDNCDEELLVSYTDSYHINKCESGRVTRVYYVTDQSGNTTNRVQYIHVERDTTPPEFSRFPDDKTVDCQDAVGDLYNTWIRLQRDVVNAVDKGCDGIIYTDNAPETTKVIGACGVITVNFVATDSCGNSDSTSAIFEIIDDIPPVIRKNPESLTLDCADKTSMTQFQAWIDNVGGAEAEENCSNLTWKTIPEDILGSLECGTINRVAFVAMDACNNADTAYTTVSISDETPPVYTDQPDTRIRDCDGFQVLENFERYLANIGDARVRDYCTPTDSIMFLYIISGDTTDYNGIIDSLLLSHGKGCRDGVLLEGQEYNNIVADVEFQFLAVDRCLNKQASESVVFAVRDAKGPVLIFPGNDILIECQSDSSIVEQFRGWYHNAAGAQISDDCGGVEVTSIPSEEELLDSILNSSRLCDIQTGGVNVEFFVSDLCGNYVGESFKASFELIDTIAPQILLSAQDTVYQCNENVSDRLKDYINALGYGQYMDACSDSLQSLFHWVDVNGNEGNGIIGQGPYPNISGIGCNYYIVFDWNTSDECRNTTTDTARWTLIDTISPDFSNFQDTIYVDCDSIPGIEGANVLYACASNAKINIKQQEIRSGSDTTCSYYKFRIERSYFISHSCNESDTLEQVIFVKDQSPPTFDLPQDVTLDCGSSLDTSITGTPSNILDGCGSPVEYTFQDQRIELNCGYRITRHWTFSDVCGNDTSSFQNIDVIDTLKPSISHSFSDTTLSCDKYIDVEIAFENWIQELSKNTQAEDNCALKTYFIATTGTYEISDTGTYPNALPRWTEELTCKDSIIASQSIDLVAIDECGLSKVESLTFSVLDTTGPHLVCISDTLRILADTMNCKGIVQMDFLTASDYCSPQDSLLWTIESQGNKNTTSQIDTIEFELSVGLHEFSVTVSDCVGNQSMCRFFVLMRDSFPPLLDCPADTALVLSKDRCSMPYTIPDVYYQNSCDSIISYTYEVSGATTISVTTYGNNENIFLNPGTSSISITVVDASFNTSKCQYKVEVRDTVSPVAICQQVDIEVPVSGVHTYTIQPAMLDDGSYDNCRIDTAYVMPSEITCDMIGDSVKVKYIVRDDYGLQDTCETFIYVKKVKLQPSYFVDFCSPDTLFLYAQAKPDSFQYQYVWSGPSGFESSLENPIIIHPTEADTGTYTLVITGITGCSDTAEIYISLDDFRKPHLMPIQSTVCVGDNVQLQSTEYNSVVQYTWYKGIFPNGEEIAQTDTAALTVLSAIGREKYYVVASNSNCISDPSNIVTINAVEQPELMVEDTLHICEGDTIQLQVSNFDTSVTYIWSGPRNYSKSGNQVFTIPNVRLNQQGKYSVVGHIGDCFSEEYTIYVDVIPRPSPPQLDFNVIVCDGDTLRIQSHIEQGVMDVIWTHESKMSYHSDTSSTFVIVADKDLHQGLWKAHTIANGCRSEYSNEIHVKVNPLPVIDIETNAPVCEGSEVQLSTIEQMDASYVWESPSGEVKGGRIVSFLAEEGDYILEVTTADFCSEIDTTTVELTQAVVIEDVDIQGVMCVDSVVSLTFIPQTSEVLDSSMEVQWLHNGQVISTEDSLLLTNADSTKNGSYDLVISKGSCHSDTFSTKLNLHMIPDKPEITGDIVQCEGEEFLLFVNEQYSGADSFIWIMNGDTLSQSSDSIMVNDQEKGETQIVLFARNGECYSQEGDTLNINIVDLPDPNDYKVDNKICEGDSLYFNLPDIPGAKYIWQNPNGTRDTTNHDYLIYPANKNHAGNYSVKIIAGECQTDFSDDIPVKINLIPILPIIDVVEDGICIIPDSKIRACISGQSASPGAMYQWINANDNRPLGSPTAALCQDITDLSSLKDGSNSLIVQAIVEECASKTSLPVEYEVSIPPKEQADAGLDIATCTENIDKLDATQPTDGVGRWEVLTSGSELENYTQANAQIKTLIPGTNSFIWVLSYRFCDAYSLDTVHVFYDVPPTAIADNYSIPYGGSIELNVYENDDILGGYKLKFIQEPMNGRIITQGLKNLYFPHNGYLGDDMFLYEICSAVCPEKCDTATVNIKIGDISKCDIPNIFTPNNDGTNDLFIVQCLISSTYRNNSLIIFNINGDEVFHASPYKNDWAGTFQGQDLPVGTYFYILDFGDGSEIKKGYLILER